MPIPQHIFRGYDIRGLKEEITPEVAEKVAKGLVYLTKAKKVVVGHDMRETSPELAEVAIKTLIERGIEVNDIGLCTTPLFKFAVTSFGDVDAGIMITASHNPAEYNGIKMQRGNSLAIPGTEIQEYLEKDIGISEKKGSRIVCDALTPYLERCAKEAGIDDKGETRVVIDYGNGMGALTLRPLCARVGIKALELYAEPDATFPNHEANPAKEETLADLKEKVKEMGANFGVALDGDADRIGFVDNEGVAVTGDVLLALMGSYFLEKHPGGKILYSINSSWIVEDVVRHAGGIPVPSPVGHAKVTKLMCEEGAILGGEVSNHFFFAEFNNVEASEFVFLTVLGIWKRSGKTFADLVRPLRKYFNSQEMNYEVEDKDGAIAALQKAYESQATKCISIDGLRYEFDRDWWILVRKSNTEPLIRVTIEAKSAELLEEKKKEVIALLEPFMQHE